MSCVSIVSDDGTTMYTQHVRTYVGGAAAACAACVVTYVAGTGLCTAAEASLMIAYQENAIYITYHGESRVCFACMYYTRCLLSR